MKLPVRPALSPLCPLAGHRRQQLRSAPGVRELTCLTGHLHAPPSYHSHLRPALLSLTPGAAGGQGILQDSLLRPLPLRASLLLHSRTGEGVRGGEGGGAGSQWGGVRGHRGVGSWVEGV